eukprot:CAMPEP_0119311742 /NCGR_PEP_ID=MMETSP1333-20130426/23717_1 /TAXON_ID=418940 /ORGANISM="Scyphosphaera apsteinii, Strain RCC1455" /LENGTH=40 /DNA_ID= /DNA_START= /DNA_END= /DNA_ORIENTATION=
MLRGELAIIALNKHLKPTDPLTKLRMAVGDAQLERVIGRL